MSLRHIFALCVCLMSAGCVTLGGSSTSPGKGPNGPIARVGGVVIDDAQDLTQLAAAAGAVGAASTVCKLGADDLDREIKTVSEVAPMTGRRGPGVAKGAVWKAYDDARRQTQAGYAGAGGCTAEARERVGKMKDNLLAGLRAPAFRSWLTAL